MEIIPLWTSHYSLHKSILTLEKYGTSSHTEADSIINLCLENSIKNVFLVENTLAGYLEAYTNCKQANLNLNFGYKVHVCSNIEEKTEEQNNTCSKIIIFCKEASGYEKLIKLYSIANGDGFYYFPRLDYKTLHKYWGDDLILAIPFYDSFVHLNFFTGKKCVPEFKDIEPFYFVENNELPFDLALEERVRQIAPKEKIIKAKTIYYAKRKDFLAYLTFRCIENRTTISKPELDHFCSSEFCLESYLEKKI